MNREEAIKNVRSFIGQLTEGCQEAIKALVPELRESEDERMIDELIGGLMKQRDAALRGSKETDCVLPGFSISANTIIAYLKDKHCVWLEKHKEQKTDIYAKTETEYADKYSRDVWEKLMSKFKTIEGYRIGCNDVSDIVLNAILNAFKWERAKNKPAVKVPECSKEWFDEDTSKMLFIQALERVEDLNNKGYFLTECDKESWWKDFKANALGTCQQTAEWSEEDERMLERCISKMKHYVPVSGNDGRLKTFEPIQDKECVDWLNLIRSRLRWKPSEYTLSLVKKVADGEMLTGMEQMAMGTIYNDLKKLM